MVSAHVAECLRQPAWRIALRGVGLEFHPAGTCLLDMRLRTVEVAVAEELHFSRAADRLNMSQSTLSKQILKLENELGFRLFEHNHQAAELTDAGRVFIAEAREVVAHAERAVLSARAIADGPVEVLNIGKSSYTDPLFVSTLLSIHLPLFPDMKIKLWSNYSKRFSAARDCRCPRSCFDNGRASQAEAKHNEHCKQSLLHRHVGRR